MRQNGLRRAINWTAAFLVLPVAFVFNADGNLFPLFQVQTQDMPILVALPFLILIAIAVAPHVRLGLRAPSGRVWLALGIVVMLLLGFGSYALMGDFPLSRDEEMVVFDMAVYDRLRLAAPMAPQWRDYAQTLVPAFLLRVDHPIGLVSAYLPGNALLRLAFSKIADPAFFNPMLALVGGAALFDIGKRLFAGDVRARCVVLLVYLLSSQMLVAAMTTYSMTAHMALNMVWLCAFLRGGRAGHGVAIVTGFVAVGLHQLVFHPIFILPFLLWRLRQGEWRLVLVYGAAYAAILGWWIYYPHIAALYVGVAPHDAASEQNFLTGRVLPLILYREDHTTGMMILNLLRFWAWQNLALLPLMVAAIPVALRSRGAAAPLLGGIVLLLVFITLVLPFQGHGWGYRYLHPYLGSFALLAGYGYRRLGEQMGEAADALVVMLSALTLFASIPFTFSRTYAFVAPHVALERSIAARTEDFVVIDTENLPSGGGHWAVNAVDHVRNLPDLDNRPLRFSSRTMNRAMVAELCRRGSVGVVNRIDMHRVGFGWSGPEPSPAFEAKIAVLRQPPCRPRAVKD